MASKRHCVSRGRRSVKNCNFNTGYKFLRLVDCLCKVAHSIYFQYSLVNIVDQCVHLARGRSINRDCGSKEHRADRGFTDVAHGSKGHFNRRHGHVGFTPRNRTFGRTVTMSEKCRLRKWSCRAYVDRRARTSAPRESHISEFRPECFGCGHKEHGSQADDFFSRTSIPQIS